MYCPKCGVRNVEDAKYCRSCGADIGLVPQAMSRTLPEGAFGVLDVEEEESKGRKRRKNKIKEPPTLEKGLENVCTGIALMIIFFLGFFYFTGLFLVWVWFIIPGLATIGEGIGQVIRARREPLALPRSTFRVEELGLPDATPRAELSQRDTSEMNPRPPSVTEGTTRHLDAAGAAKK